MRPDRPLRGRSRSGAGGAEAPKLSAEGLIEHWPHRGALVRRLTEREIRELFAIRVEMEALGARLAAAADSADRRARYVASIQPIYADAPPRMRIPRKMAPSTMR
jgi:hypothetical protein